VRNAIPLNIFQRDIKCFSFCHRYLRACEC
jgi:hypothetical protein